MVFAQVWSLLPQAAGAFAAFAEGAAGGEAPAGTPARGVIPFRGFVAQGVCGAADPLETMRALDRALAADGEATLEIDSPGGSTAGVAELAGFIAEAVRAGLAVHAFTRGLCCSAAYWVACRCSDITATRGAVLGNVGAYAVHLSHSRANARAGLDVTLFTSGELKAAGHPDFPLSAAQRGFLAGHVGEVAGQFLEDVAAGRPKADLKAVRTGGWWLAGKARALGLVDHLALDLPSIRKD